MTSLDIQRFLMVFFAWSTPIPPIAFPRAANDDLESRLRRGKCFVQYTKQRTLIRRVLVYLPSERQSRAEAVVRPPKRTALISIYLISLRFKLRWLSASRPKVVKPHLPLSSHHADHLPLTHHYVSSSESGSLWAWASDINSE